MQSMRKAASVALPITGVMIFSSGVLAQENMPLQTLSKVVATDDAEKQSATQNSTLISSEHIDNQQATDLEDLVRYIPGVDVSDIGRFGSNGFNIRGLDGDQVAMSVDGLSFGETLDPASYQPYDFFRSTRGGLDVDALKSVEIVKGADSIALGSGGLSGGVLFVTKDPADYLQAQGNDLHLGAKVGYASANSEGMLTGTFAGRLDQQERGQWESLLVATGRKGHETQVQGSGANISGAAREIADPLDLKSHSILFKLINQISADHRIGMVVDLYNANAQMNNQSRVNSTYRTRTTDDEQERKRVGINYEWSKNGGPFDLLSSSYDFLSSKSTGYTKMLFVSTGCPTGLWPCNRTEDRYYDQDTHTLKLRFNKALSSAAVQQSILYGIGTELRDVSFSSIDTRYVGASDTVGTVEVDPDFVPETRTRNINAYLRDEIDLANQPWRFRIGGRFDSYHYSPSFNAQYQDPSGTVGDLNFSAFTWQSGVDFKFTTAQTLSLQLGSGFRAPSTENLYFATQTSPGTDPVTNAAVVLWDSVANPNLKNEKSLNTELSYHWKTTRHDLTLAAFRDRYSNFIETQTLYRQVGSINDDYTTTINTGEVTVTGAEISSRWILSNHLALGFAYSWNKGEKKNGDPLLSIVPASGVLGLEYQALENRLAASINVTHADAKERKDTLQTNSSGAQIAGTSFVTDSFTLVDLQSRFQVTKRLKLTAGVYNVLDEQYWRWSRVRFVSEGTGGARGGVSGNGLNRYAEPGRNFKATVSYAF